VIISKKDVMPIAMMAMVRFDRNLLLLIARRDNDMMSKYLIAED
jgi:hypothetical protein